MIGNENYISFDLCFCHENQILSFNERCIQWQVAGGLPHLPVCNASKEGKFCETLRGAGSATSTGDPFLPFSTQLIARSLGKFPSQKVGSRKKQPLTKGSFFFFSFLSRFRGGESLYWGQMLVVRSISFMDSFEVYYSVFFDWPSELQSFAQSDKYIDGMIWDTSCTFFQEKTLHFFEQKNRSWSGLQSRSFGSCQFLFDLSVHWFPYGECQLRGL